MTLAFAKSAVGAARSARIAWQTLALVGDYVSGGLHMQFRAALHLRMAQPRCTSCCAACGNHCAPAGRPVQQQCSLSAAYSVPPVSVNVNARPSHLCCAPWSVLLLLLLCVLQAYWFIDFYTLDWGREKIEEFMDTCQVGGQGSDRLVRRAAIMSSLLSVRNSHLHSVCDSPADGLPAWLWAKAW